MKILLAAGASTAWMLCAACTTSNTGDDAYYLALEDGERAECRRVEELGSRLGKRVCRSVEEWEQIDEQSEEDSQEFLRNVRGATYPGRSGDGGGL